MRFMYDVHIEVGGILSMVYMGEAVRDNINILGHCNASVYPYVCLKLEDTKISKVSHINHTECAPKANILRRFLEFMYNRDLVYRRHM